MGGGGDGGRRVRPPAWVPVQGGPPALRIQDLQVDQVAQPRAEPPAPVVENRVQLASRNGYEARQRAAERRRLALLSPNVS